MPGLIVVALLASAVRPGLPVRAATHTQGGFTTVATVAAADVSPGGTAAIAARVTSVTARTVRVDIEVWGPTGTRLAQTDYNLEAFSPGVERSFPFSWPVPIGAEVGGYTVKIGLFSTDPGWTDNYHWNDSAGFFSVGMGAPPPPGGPTRIMPLGDSLTDGYNIPGGYRIDLWTKLANAAKSVDYVGSRYNGPLGLADKHHEGHSGWRIDQLADAATPWLLAYRPQIVLLLIGTNDMVQNHDVAGAPDRLGALIDQIRAAVPDARIVVSTLPRNTDVATLQRIEAFNDAIPAVVAARGPQVTSVNAFTAILASHLDVDGTHLNANGSSKLADVWFPAVLSILNLPPTPTPTLTSTVTSTPTRTPTVTPTMTPTLAPDPCLPRPPVSLAVTVAGAGQLQVVVAAGGASNGLREIVVGEARNAAVTVNGQAAGIGASVVVVLPGTPLTAVVGVTRLRAGEAVHVPLVVVDRCGPWPTFVGGGPAAF